MQYGRAYGFSEKRRNPAGFPENAFDRTICLITAKKLVSAVSAQGNRYMFPRHPADQIRRYLGRIRKRFSEHGSKLRYYLFGILFRDIQLRMFRSQMRRNFFRDFRFVKFLFPHAYGIASDMPAAYLPHQRYDRGTVDSGRQERADGYIRRHLSPNRIL